MKKAFLMILEMPEGCDTNAKELHALFDDKLSQIQFFDTLEVKDLTLPQGIAFCEKNGCIADERNCWGGVEACYLEEECPFSKPGKSMWWDARRKI